MYLTVVLEIQFRTTFMKAAAAAKKWERINTNHSKLYQMDKQFFFVVVVAGYHGKSQTTLI